MSQQVVTFTDRQRSLALFWPTVGALAGICLIVAGMLYAGLNHIPQPRLAQAQTTQVR
jgi:hypothetical protein